MFPSKSIFLAIALSGATITTATAMFHNSYLMIDLGLVLKEKKATKFVQSNLPTVTAPSAKAESKTNSVLALNSTERENNSKKEDVDFLKNDDFNSMTFDQTQETEYFSDFESFK